MKKISTVQVFGNEIFKEQQLTIGVDLGDRWSFYGVLDEAGKIILEQKKKEEEERRRRKKKKNILDTHRPSHGRS
jgi:predicted NBD/HSP70 family sugar kinase